MHATVLRAVMTWTGSKRVHLSNSANAWQQPAALCGRVKPSSLRTTDGASYRTLGLTEATCPRCLALAAE